MANVGRTRRPGDRGHSQSQNPVVQEFVRSAGWTEDSNGHYLLMDLPDSKKEVKLQVDTSGHLTISGERPSSDNKCIMRFEKVFTLPPNSDLNNLSGKFDGEILRVTVPKLTKQPEIHKQNINDVVEANKQETTLRNDENVNKDNEKQADDHGHGSQSDHYKKEKRGKNSEVDGFGEDFVRKWEKEPCQFKRVMKILKRNNGIVITALLAFSLGVLVSRKFQSARHKGAV